MLLNALVLAALAGPPDYVVLFGFAKSHPYHAAAAKLTEHHGTCSASIPSIPSGSVSFRWACMRGSSQLRTVAQHVTKITATVGAGCSRVGRGGSGANRGVAGNAREAHADARGSVGRRGETRT